MRPTADEEVVMWCLLIIAFFGVSAYSANYFWTQEKMYLFERILYLIFFSPAYLFAAVVFASIAFVPYAYCKIYIKEYTRWRLEERKKLLHKKLAEMVACGPINHRRMRVDPSYLDDAERLESLAEHETDPSVREAMREYCELNKQMQSSN